MFQMIKSLFTKKQSPRFVDVLLEYVEKYKSQNDLKEGTVKLYNVYMKNITWFLHDTKQYNINMSEVNEKLTMELTYWLHKKLETCLTSHSSRHVELIKRVSKYAVKMEYITADRVSPVRTGRDRPKEVIYLNDKELTKLENSKFETHIYVITRDLFLFQCYTGVSYADIYTYEMVEENGNMWFVGNRTKTGVKNTVFVFPQAYRIWIKYSGKLPHIANQTYNRALKEISAQIGIKKHLTTHIGRKTHAMMLKRNGVDSKAGSIQLGNTLQVFDTYYNDDSQEILLNEINRTGLNKNLKLVS